MLDPRPKPAPSVTVLLVDGTPRDMRIVGELLREQGHDVVSAGSGMEALGSLESIRPDVILLDALLPGNSGYELCRKLRGTPATRDIPVVFLSAVADKGFVMEAFDAGGADYITKPFHGPELISRVEHHANLRRYRTELETVIREKNRLLEIVAHDMKNPLSGIQFAATILSEDPHLPVDSRVGLVESIRQSTERAFEIVANTLETQSIQFASTPVTHAVLSLDGHVDQAISNFEQHCRRKDIRINVLRCDGGLSVVGESRLLMCCIENLVSNAIKFSPHGSTVTIHLQRDQRHGIFRIEDEGPGILDEEVPLLFGKFTRLSARPTNGEASTGLGLHIVHELVTAMDGSVSHVPGGGKRSVFLMALPLAESSA